MTPIHDDAWLMLGCDLCGPFPLGESLLVYIEYYTGYRSFEILHKKTTSNMTNKLRKVLCRYGALATLVTDNGPQFTHNETFDEFMKELGVNHKKVTPYNPEANLRSKDSTKTLKNLSKQLLLLNNSFKKLLVILSNYSTCNDRVSTSKTTVWI